MDERYSDALRFLREARSLPDLPHLEARFAGLVSRFGFERTTYVLMAQPGRPINPKVLFGVGDPKLRNVYLGAERFRIDPTFQAVFHKTRAFTWTDVEPLAVSEPARQLFDNARKDGSEGLIVPVHGAHGEVSALVMVGRNVELNDQAKAVLQAAGLCSPWPACSSWNSPTTARATPTSPGARPRCWSGSLAARPCLRRPLSSTFLSAPPRRTSNAPRRSWGASPPCPRCWKPPDAAGSSIQMSLNNVKL